MFHPPYTIETNQLGGIFEKHYFSWLCRTELKQFAHAFATSNLSAIND
jgi:hypothetical protein